jgi:large conductance mechanosensitive channel
MWREFKAFIMRENVLALAIAVVLGAAAGKVVTAVVEDFIMPIVSAVAPSGAWQTTTVAIGSVRFKIGDFMSVLLNFLIIGFVVWRISKVFTPKAPTPAGPITRPCPYCKMAIDPQATRCSHCTSEIAVLAVPRLTG